MWQLSFEQNVHDSSTFMVNFQYERCTKGQLSCFIGRTCDTFNWEKNPFHIHLFIKTPRCVKMLGNQFFTTIKIRPTFFLNNENYWYPLRKRAPTRLVRRPNLIVRLHKTDGRLTESLTVRWAIPRCSIIPKTSRRFPKERLPVRAGGQTTCLLNLASADIPFHQIKVSLYRRTNEKIYRQAHI